MRKRPPSARRGPAAFAVLVSLATIGPAVAADRIDDVEALRTSQAAIGRTLDGFVFTTADGERLAIEDLRGRPLVLSLIYTSCYYVCSGITLQLRKSVGIARDALGPRNFNVLTIGFDAANDTPTRMGQYARERGVDVPGWTFASADARTIERLVEAVGFTYLPSAKGYDHITQTTIVDARGRIVSQVYGQEFAPPLLVEPLKRLSLGQAVAAGGVEGLLGQLKLFCTIYDPTSGRYRFDYSLIVEVVAGLLAAGMAAAGIVAFSRNVR
jgi:protein SCO1/2